MGYGRSVCFSWLLFGTKKIMKWGDPLCTLTWAWCTYYGMLGNDKFLIYKLWHLIVVMIYKGSSIYKFSLTSQLAKFLSMTLGVESINLTWKKKQNVNLNSLPLVSQIYNMTARQQERPKKLSKQATFSVQKNCAYHKC